jgi:molybdopterin-containing oxidoreductase family iron-sulfur binding subunit
MKSDASLDLEMIRRRLAGVRGRKYWRCLEEVAETPAFEEFLHREFPAGASEWGDEFSRRGFLQLMAASFALAGFSACTKQPLEKIVPYVRQPVELTPGKPLYFATALTLGGFAQGIVATSHEGRPTKIEGNPDHPASLGATSIYTQASVLDLYDPDRAQTLLRAGQPSDWGTFVSAMHAIMQDQQTKMGAGVRILTGSVTSPTLVSQLTAFLRQYTAAKWHQWEPLSRDNIRDGAWQAFGEIVETQYAFEKADVVLALDADFLVTHPSSLRYARDFAGRRRVKGAAEAKMNRLYAAEPTPTITGAMADHRLPVSSAEIEVIARSLAQKLGIEVEAAVTPHDEWASAVARDLQAHPGASLVIAGETQSAAVHMLVHLINAKLNNPGQTLTYTVPAEPVPVNQLTSLQTLIKDLQSGVVDLLVMIEGNPVFDTPADLGFAEAVAKAKTVVRLGFEENETSRYCHWHVPAAHALESWGDACAFDGTVSLVQPLIEPLFEGKTAHELIDALFQPPGRNVYDIVRAYWQAQKWPNFEKAWRTALNDGVIAGSAAATQQVKLAAKTPAVAAPAAGKLEILFRPDPSIWDGRFVNNGWLQELPRPVSKLTWDNAALVSPMLAQREKLENGDVVILKFGGRTLRAPVWVMPGQAENSVTLHLGYGRERTGRVGTGAGFNAYALRTSQALWSGAGLEIKRTGEKYPLVDTQKHHSIEGRDIVRSGTIGEFAANVHFLEAHKEPRPERDVTLYHSDEFKYDGYKWGMSIDLNVCIGCNACTIACQAENNIAVVGKAQVANGRAMHWIRVDGYFEGSLDNPEVNHQPVPCMHCENAPCELVCPVGATVHDDEGLNVQVYNRCIGTRYCSNNCPYKVRRFNFLEFNAGMTAVQKMVKNPDVTVRSRGVMEKCTYCTQRINAARITAEIASRKIRDGEIVTACQAACPVEAIVFGDLNDRESRVAKLKGQPLDYGMLGELNTRPRTSYLAKLRNPNPEMKT